MVGHWLSNRVPKLGWSARKSSRKLFLRICIYSLSVKIITSTLFIIIVGNYKMFLFNANRPFQNSWWVDLWLLLSSIFYCIL
jgi:hypothetical protein